MELTEKDEARFWSKVALPNEQGCMLWMRCTRKDGYGWFHLNGQAVRAHRISYVLAYGQIPPGLVIDHVKERGCTNRHCVAPDHLEAVTQRENLLRGDTLVAHSLAKTHCPQGHPLSGENLYLYRGKYRRCRACHRAEARKYRKAA